MIFRRENDNKQNSAADSGDPSTMEQSAMPPQNAGGFAMPSVGGSASPKQATAAKEESPEEALGNLEVSSGQMTFDAEGNDNPNSPYFTRSIHYPPVGSSGVTVGRGYDMGSRSSKEILGHMKAAGVPSDKASLLSKAAGKKGEAAREFVQDNKAKIGNISHSQQKHLFSIVYAELKKDAVRISNKQGVIDAYGETDFDTLHPAITDLLVDLRYRGDYKPSTRKWIQTHIANNDLDKLTAIMADTTWMTKYGVPKDRFKRRKEFMANALAGNPQATLQESSKEEAEQAPTMTPIHYGAVDAPGGLNVRAGVGVSNSKVGLLGDGEEVTVYEEKDGWLRIGVNEWVHGGYIKKTARPQEPEQEEPVFEGVEVQITEAPKEEKALFPGMVTATQLNVRNGGSGEADKVGMLNQGESVQIFEQVGSWVRIGKNEWVHGSYVKITPKIEEPEIEEKEPTENGNVEQISTGTVTASSLNVRDAGSGDGNKVGMLKEGDSVEIYEQKGDWIRIGEGRWVHANYVDISKEEVKEEAKPEVKEEEAVTDTKDPVEKSNDSANTVLDGTWLDNTMVESAWDWLTGPSPEKEQPEQEQPTVTKEPEQEIVPVTAEPAKEKEQIESQLDDLMKKDRLTPEEIKTVRGEIEKVEDVDEKKKLYQNLASKVKYTNQRQSEVKDENGAYAEKSYGGMCNLASLSMVLQYLGISNPNPDLQYQDSLEKKRQELIESGKFKKSDSRLNWDVWERLATEMGASGHERFYPGTKNKEYYQKNLLPAIQSGAGIMLSFAGHIVRLENITDQGFIIDDPYGKSDIVTRNKNGKGGWLGYNGKRGSESKDVGEDNLWTWDAIEQVNIRGAIVIYP